MKDKNRERERSDRDDQALFFFSTPRLPAQPFHSSFLFHCLSFPWHERTCASSCYLQQFLRSWQQSRTPVSRTRLTPPWKSTAVVSTLSPRISCHASIAADRSTQVSRSLHPAPTKNSPTQRKSPSLSVSGSNQLNLCVRFDYMISYLCAIASPPTQCPCQGYQRRWCMCLI